MSGTAIRLLKEKRSGRRRHAFGGCRTCRGRHVKCDQIRPTCLTCRAADLVCEGYTSNVRWMPLSTLSSPHGGQAVLDDASKNATRRHLYSEAARQSMSSSLVTGLGSKTIDASLADIDARTKDPEELEDVEFAVGPFGVFCSGNAREPMLEQEAVHHVQPYLESDQPAIEDSGSSMNIMPDEDLPPIPSQLVDLPHQVPSLVDWFDPILGFDNTLHWADLFDLDFGDGNNLLQPNPVNSLDFYSFETAEQAIGPLSCHQNLNSMLGPLNGSSAHTADVLAEHEVSDSRISQATLNHLSDLKSVDEAQFLLKHFHNSVIPQMAFMIQSSKSPWRILQLPDAIRTLSELTYLQTGSLKHANAANFYALMACSAYHISARPSLDPLAQPKEYWQNLFNRLREASKIHIQISLREELKGPRKAKYKDQLMAVLSMLAASSLSGNQRDARCLMIDAERLLRVKGLAKRDISRKCRLLHHVYTYIRIVGESTYVIHDYQTYGPVIDNMSLAYQAGRIHGSPDSRREPPRSGHNARLDDFLRLEAHSSDSDLEIEDQKEHDVGLYDIHLEDSRQYRGTMYQVYGISETWLSLVSQTTRLANILAATKHGKETDVKFLEFLQKRAGRLENIVCSFALKDPADDEDAASESTMAQDPNYHMLRAMNSALVILFYRRVRNVNPLILQGHVDSVVQSLKEYDSAILSQTLQGPGSAWPAFIAGCEALSRRNRSFFKAWLDKGFQQCGLECFETSRKLMAEVWERQDDPGILNDPGSGGSSQSRSQRSSSYHRTWVDISREKDSWIILF